MIFLVLFGIAQGLEGMGRISLNNTKKNAELVEVNILAAINQAGNTGSFLGFEIVNKDDFRKCGDDPIVLVSEKGRELVVFALDCSSSDKLYRCSSISLDDKYFRSYDFVSKEAFADGEVKKCDDY